MPVGHFCPSHLDRAAESRQLAAADRANDAVLKDEGQARRLSGGPRPPPPVRVLHVRGDVETPAWTSSSWPRRVTPGRHYTSELIVRQLPRLQARRVVRCLQYGQRGTDRHPRVCVRALCVLVPARSPDAPAGARAAARAVMIVAAPGVPHAIMPMCCAAGHPKRWCRSGRWRPRRWARSCAPSASVMSASSKPLWVRRCGGRGRWARGRERLASSWTWTRRSARWPARPSTA